MTSRTAFNLSFNICANVKSVDPRKISQETYITQHYLCRQ